MPNGFAYFMLFCWPFVGWVLFRSLPLSKALIWTILAGYLILPSELGVKVPMLPIIDKGLMPTLSAAIFCLLYEPRVRGGSMLQPAARLGAAGGRAVIIGLLVLLFVAPVLSVLFNPEPLIMGARYLPGLTIYDAFSMISASVVSILPFLLAWRYLRTREAHRQLLVAFVVAGLVYSLPVLFEVRMSPQLHIWTYGFFPTDFLMHIRDGGYRPVVFLHHGLMVGMLLCTSVLAAIGLWREDRRERKPAAKWLFAACWLMLTLVLSKNLGALGIALTLGALLVTTGQRVQAMAAAAIALIVLFYPILRGAGIIPVETVHELALSISDERAQSLEFRLDNENALLDHANKKPMTGWGSWGRNHLYNPETGAMTTTTDGMWVILIGVYGWPGYIAHFGLLTLPLLLYARRRRDFGPSLTTPALMIVMSAALIDLLPNAGLVPYVWLMAGAMTGFVLTRTAPVPRQAAAHPTGTPHVARRLPILNRPVST